jgi:tellurite resistance protein TerC
MLAVTPVSGWLWVAFIGSVLFFLALDLGVFHRHAHVVKFKEAFLWTTAWFCLAMLFAFTLKHTRGETDALEFLTGYLIELSLSMDNVFVMVLIFAYFQVPPEHQHRVLFWGILGALVMRGFMIAAGLALIAYLHWVFYFFGILLVYSGIRMLLVKTEVAPEKNRVIKLARKFFPVAPRLDGQKFRTRWNGRMALTPLALVLIMIETTDVVFAADSIPAVFAVTTKPFVVFTSNVFAILGLRSLYFVLAGAITSFRYLKYGISTVLVFIGIKMLIAPHGLQLRWIEVEIPIGISLFVVAAIILLSIVLSVLAAWREKRNRPQMTADERR